jgi:hypothetical protein
MMRPTINEESDCLWKKNLLRREGINLDRTLTESYQTIAEKINKSRATLKIIAHCLT